MFPKNKKNFLALFSLIFFLSPLIGFSQGLVPCGGPEQRACQFCDIFVVISNIINFLLIKLVPLLMVILIALGGGMFLLGAENPKMIENGKNMIKAVLIGALIVYSAWLIVGLFFNLIGLADWAKSWWKNGFFEIKCS